MTTTTASWYDDPGERARDDALLQDAYRQVRAGLPPATRRRLRRVHAYPSRGCTYTLSKRRIFVRVRDAAGRPLAVCALRHVLLHELAHVLNPTVGHDRGFRAVLARLAAWVAACPGGVPRRWNPCH